MDTATQVQILDEAVCISQRIDTVEKWMNQAVLPSAMDK